MSAWRRLTGGGRGRDAERRTLIACSGGADSSALALALAARVRSPAQVLVIAHVLHDLRPRAAASADLGATRSLAARLDLGFSVAEVRVRALGGNLEADARRLRYRALARLARVHNCPFVATAHHADDQLESVLMALLRGAGPRGLAGIAESRSLAPACRLVRPMLCVGRREAREICDRAGHPWQEDATNVDESRLRGALRARVLPVLSELRPAASRHAVESGRLLRDAAEIISKEAMSLPQGRGSDETRGTLPHGRVTFWPRDPLRAQPGAVVGEAIRLHARSLLGSRGLDRLGTKHLNQAVRAIRSPATDPKVFWWAGLRVTVTARRVHMEVE